MDNAIIGAIIGGVAAIIAAIIQTIEKRKAVKGKRETEEAVRKFGEIGSSPEEGIEPLAFSYKLDFLESVSQFGDDASGEMDRRFHGIQALQMITDLKVPFYSNTDCPSGSLGSPTVKEFLGASRPVQLEIQQQTISKIVGFVTIGGLIDNTTRDVGFVVYQPFNKAYCMTREEAQEAYKNDDFKFEYHSTRVFCPTSRLKIGITFPKSFKGRIAPAAIAFIEGSETIHSEETKRIENNFNYVKEDATLIVENPSITITYAIYWMPP